MIERNYSVVDSEPLKPLITLKNFPVFFGCTDEKPEDDLFADMEWSIDKNGVVQLSKLVPQKILYQAQHIDGCGSTWEQYYNNFVSFIVKQNPHNVLEIGGGQGRLAEMILSKRPNLEWSIVDPNPTYNGSNIELIRGFFDDDFEWNKPLDTIVFSQVLEHAYEPEKFIAKIASLLPLGGKVIFAYPHLELWVRNKYTNALNFEHTMFLTDYFVDYLLKKNGFNIIKKVQYLDHSFFYVAEKTYLENNVSIPHGRYSEDEKIFMEFIDYHTHVVEGLNKMIDVMNNPIYLFGAHIFSQYLLCFGLKHEKIISILDNSRTKQGRRLYGTRFIVQSPEVLREHERPVVILKAGIYNDEIKKDIIENINSRTIFWE